MEGSPLLNSLVSDLEDGTVQELLVAERCTTETDKKDYVIAAAVSSLTLSFCLCHSSPHISSFSPSLTPSSSCVIPPPPPISSFPPSLTPSSSSILLPHSQLLLSSSQNALVSTGTLLHLLAFVGRNDAAEWLLKNGAFVYSQNHVSPSCNDDVIATPLVSFSRLAPLLCTWQLLGSTPT